VAGRLFFTLLFILSFVWAGESHTVMQWVYRSGFGTELLDFGQYVFTPEAIGSTGNMSDWLIRNGQLNGSLYSLWSDSSLALGDVGNIGIPWNFSWDQGDTNVCFFDLDSNPYTILHKGFYAVCACTLNSAQLYDTIRLCTLRQVPIPSVSQPPNLPVRVQVTWNQPVYDTSTISSSRIDWNPIRGYAVYRSTDGSVSWVRVDTGLANPDTFIPYQTLSFEDSSVVVGQTYYYALRLIYWGSQIKDLDQAKDTVIIGSVLSGNSNSITIQPISVDETPKETPEFRFVVSPNPIKKKMKVEYSLSQPGSVTFLLYNIIGRQVKQWQIIDSKNHQQVIEVGQLPKGIYFLILETEERRVMRKIIIE